MRNKDTVQRQNKRQALIEAAVRLMVEKGDPRLVSTRAVVSMAQTSKSWSPDGKKLLYIKGNVEKNKARIWICDADGGNQTQLSVGSGEFNDIDARWSNDSKKIIFSSNRSLLKGKHNYDIYIMDAEGGNLTQLTTNGSHDDKPVFAPDGRTVFFRSNRGLVWDIWTMQINDGK